MEFTPDQVRAFRYWIQGYANFYEPIVEAYFPTAGYQVLRRPAWSAGPTSNASSTPWPTATSAWDRSWTARPSGSAWQSASASSPISCWNAVDGAIWPS